MGRWVYEGKLMKKMKTGCLNQNSVTDHRHGEKKKNNSGKWDKFFKESWREGWRV